MLDMRSRNTARSLFVLLCITALMGVLFGTLSFTVKGEALRELSFSDSLEHRIASDPASVITRSLLSTTVFLTAAYISGLCPLGQLFAIALTFFRGLGLGAALSGAYTAASRGSLIFAALLYVPGAALSLLTLIAASKEVFAMSSVYLRFTLSDKSEDGASRALKVYSVRFLALLAAGAAAASVYCLRAVLLSGYVKI